MGGGFNWFLPVPFHLPLRIVEWNRPTTLLAEQGLAGETDGKQLSNLSLPMGVEMLTIRTLIHHVEDIGVFDTFAEELAPFSCLTASLSDSTWMEYFMWSLAASANLSSPFRRNVSSRTLMTNLSSMSMSDTAANALSNGSVKVN